MFFANGGYGASARRDGYNVLSWPSNISSTPVEMIEQLAPLKIHYRRLRTGSGGAGRFRGGNGQECMLESRAGGPLTISFLAERTRPEASLRHAWSFARRCPDRSARWPDHQATGYRGLRGSQPGEGACAA